MADRRRVVGERRAPVLSPGTAFCLAHDIRRLVGPNTPDAEMRVIYLVADQVEKWRDTEIGPYARCWAETEKKEAANG